MDAVVEVVKTGIALVAVFILFRVSVRLEIENYIAKKRLEADKENKEVNND